ncbi:hypothetical protein BC833DRAFT_578723 [Globomyces pollinis-pini]|nr:hypothetical protein BC833DRAFT_578723 [Globomyces pollinis-pini]
MSYFDPEYHGFFIFKMMLTDLPNELLITIFQLTKVSDIKCISQTCRLFYRISLHKCFWNTIDLSSISSIVDDSVALILAKNNFNALNSDIKQYRCLTELSLRHCSRITDIGFIHLSRKCVGLRSINLTGCINLTDSSINVLCKVAKHLSIWILDGLEKITEESILDITTYCDIIEYLSISGCTLLIKLDIYSLHPDFNHKIKAINTTDIEHLI